MTMSIDKAGRIVVPKPLRDRLGMTPGTELVVEADGDGLVAAERRGCQRLLSFNERDFTRLGSSRVSIEIP